MTAILSGFRTEFADAGGRGTIGAMRVLAIVVVSGCWTADAPVPPQPETPAARPLAAHARHPTHWRGHYICAQGPTALDLTLERDGEALRGTFAFSELAENPGVPSGSYTLTGTSAPADRDEVVVTMTPGHWITQPDGYVMVGFTAKSDRERRILRGTINFAGCGTIEVSRAD